jgi:transcriptional regulator with XRE-family HTH domain
VDASRLILKARHGSGLNQRDLARRAGTSQATLSAYERGAKSPTLAVTERIVEAAGYHLDLVTQIQFTQHAVPGVRPFWVPDRLWRGNLPNCFATVSLQDRAYLRGVTRFSLRRRTSRRRMYELLLRNGLPEELRDWIDGALLVDLWTALRIPRPIREAWQPAVDLAGNGPIAFPLYRGPLALDLAPGDQRPRPGPVDGDAADGR